MFVSQLISGKDTFEKVVGQRTDGSRTLSETILNEIVDALDC